MESTMSRIRAVLGQVVLSLVVCFAGAAPAGEHAAVPKLSAGDLPPSILGSTRAGDEIDTRQFTGRVMVVTFWASWCGPCRKELGMLEGLQTVAKDRLKVVAVNIEERDTFRSVMRVLKDLTITITNDPHKRFADAYGVRGIPHMVIIGKDGKVISVHRGYSEAALDGLLAEINAALAAS
jgi:thiol-disulfide isomerase/thioredoxin